MTEGIECSLRFASLRLCGDISFMHENVIARIIGDTAFRIHTNLGPGLLESVYEVILAHELTKRGMTVSVQQGIPVAWDGIELPVGFRADAIVNGNVVVEIKSVEAVAPVHPKQVRTYQRLMDLRLGLLINFNADLIKNGITRVVNNL